MYEMDFRDVFNPNDWDQPLSQLLTFGEEQKTVTVTIDSV